MRYDKIFGLSCIENHVLAILRQRGEEIEYAYYNCAVPLGNLYTHLVLDGVKQEYFNLIERIQDALKNLGIIELTRVIPMQFADVKRAVCACRENEYILIRVTLHFTKSILMARGFREDHFVYVRPCGNDFEVFNDIPERVTMLTGKQLAEVYDGEYFHLSVKRKLNGEDINLLWNLRSFKPEEFRRHNIGADNFDNVKDIGVRLRNLTGVYKTLRYRMAEYYGKYVDTRFIQEAMPPIEKIYAMFEYYNLKPGTPLDKYMYLFQSLYDLDTDLMIRLKKEMEEGR